MTLPQDEESIADFIAKKSLEDPKVKKIVQDAQLFDELRTSAAWQRLWQFANHERDRIKKVVSDHLWRGDTVTPAEVAYYRGFAQGMIWVLAHPEHAEVALERAAKRAFILSYNNEEADNE